MPPIGIIVGAGLILTLVFALALRWTVNYRRFERIVGCPPSGGASEARQVLGETREKMKRLRAGKVNNTMESLEYLRRLEVQIVGLMKFFRIPEVEK